MVLRETFFSNTKYVLGQKFLPNTWIWLSTPSTSCGNIQKAMDVSIKSHVNNINEFTHENGIEEKLNFEHRYEQ